MSKQLLLTVLAVLSFYTVFAQLPPPCGQAGDEPPGCFMCNPVYYGSSGGFTPGNTPNNFCGVIHNNQWISFQACASTISFTLNPANCQMGLGLQVVVVDQDLNPVSNCCSNSTPAVCNLTATGLNSGEIYYVMIDGSDGDICDFTLTATGGFCFGPPDPTGPIMASPALDPVCPGTRVTYSISPVNGASEYEWTVPGNATILSGDGTTEIVVDFDHPGVGQVCVTPVNPCFSGSPSCRTVQVQPLQTTVLPPRTFCQEDFPVLIDGNEFSGPGTFQVLYNSHLGCDSTVSYTLLQHPQIPRLIDTTICDGECVLVNSQYFCDPGNFVVRIPGAASTGCDSLVDLRIKTIKPVARITPPPPFPCRNAATLELDGTGSSSGATFSWRATNGGHIRSGANSPLPVVDSLGRYILSVSLPAPGGQTCTAFDTVDLVREVIPLDTIQWLIADSSVCAGALGHYRIEPVPGALNYTWGVDSAATVSGTGPEIFVNWDTLVRSTLCVEAIGACGTSPRACLPVSVYPIPEAALEASSPICRTDSSIIQYNGAPMNPNAVFHWDVDGGSPDSLSGPGPHSVSWSVAGDKTVILQTEENGCLSAPDTTLVTVTPPLPIPLINCLTTTTSITFFWDSVPGASSYYVFIPQVTGGIQLDTSLTINGLSPNDQLTLELTANSNSPCGPVMTSQTCRALECDPVDLVIEPIPPICRDVDSSIVQIQWDHIGGTGAGFGLWSGDGVSFTGRFDPTLVPLGENTVTLTYQEGACVYSEAFTIGVYEAPPAGLLADPSICADSLANLSYSGPTGPGMTYYWSLDGGLLASSSPDSSELMVSWSEDGIKTIRLQAENHGCKGLTDSITIRVDTALATPRIRCTPAIGSLTFEWDSLPGATGYDIRTLNGPTGIRNGNSYFLPGLSPEDSIAVELMANNNTACGASLVTASCTTLPCPPVNLSIDSIGPICQNGKQDSILLQATVTGGSQSDSIRWSGPGVSRNGWFDPNSAAVNPPEINIRLVFTEDICTYDTIRVVRIDPQPIPAFSTASSVCRDSLLGIRLDRPDSVNWTAYWELGDAVIRSGDPSLDTFEVSWDRSGQQTIGMVVSENGCFSDTVSATIQVDHPLLPPLLNCQTNIDQIDFQWGLVPGATDYEVRVLSGQSGTMGPTNFLVTGLAQNELVTLELIASGPNACGPSRDTLTCEAKECPDIQLEWQPVPPICLNANLTSLDLNDSLSVTGSDGTGSAVWSGSPNSVYLTRSGNFFPYSASIGDNLVQVVWTEEGCTYSTSGFVEVKPIPLAGFNAPPIACQGDTISVSSVYNPPGSNYDWSFGRAVAIAGIDQGPFELVLDQAGRDTFRLQIEANGCRSDLVEGFIDVSALLPDPVVNCTETTQSIAFSWQDVPGATGMEIDILEQPAGSVASPQGNNGLLFTGLSPNDSVTLILTARDSLSPCPPVSRELTCVAKACPPIILDLHPPTDSCWIPGTTYSSQMSATASGTDGSGMGFWSGPGIGPGGQFQTDTAGSFFVRYDFTEEGCSFSDTLEFTIHEQPSASFDLPDAICQDSLFTLSYTGTSLSGANYSWNLGGGQPGGLSGPGPHLVSWPVSGQATLSLEVLANGCSSGTYQDSIRIDAPLDSPRIDCQATTNELEFCWDPVPNAASYTVTVVNGPLGSRTGNCYRLTNLAPGTSSEIELLVQHDGSCGDITLRAACTSDSCLPVQVDILPVEPICLYPGTGSLDLSDSVVLIGNQSTGNLDWSGTGMDPAGSFNPVLAGPGTHQIRLTFRENGCSYTTDREIVVNAPPIADAGMDQLVGCLDSIADLGGPGNAGNCPCASYQWTGGPVANQFLPSTTTRMPGTYQLTVLDPETGCRATDSILIGLDDDIPELFAAVSNISCFGLNDGRITVDSVRNGSTPYLFSLNGAAFSDQREFSGLGPGNYQLVLEDLNGCRDQLEFIISEPHELSVELIIIADDLPVPLGDSIRLFALTNYAPELLQSIEWSPVEQFPNCDETNIANCLSFTVTPEGQTIYTVRVENLNGCSDTDSKTVDINKVRPVFIPTAFSPNDRDGINDVFTVFGGSQVAEVRALLIFDRWGNGVFESRNFPPGSESAGWDGTFNGKALDSGVYVYFAEVLFIDGQLLIFKGDVTLK